jgi:hypothetical protein
LPKATVQLNPPTKPLTAPGAAATQGATVQLATQVAEEKSESNTATVVLAVIGTIAAVLVVWVQYSTAGLAASVDADGQTREVPFSEHF